MHVFTFLCWTFFRITNTVESHSGYDFPFPLLGLNIHCLIPVFLKANHHDYHHAHFDGNYSSNLCFWDCLFQTDVDYH